jgi:hypothetical protein
LMLERERERKYAQRESNLQSPAAARLAC